MTGSEGRWYRGGVAFTLTMGGCRMPPPAPDAGLNQGPGAIDGVSFDVRGSNGRHIICSGNGAGTLTTKVGVKRRISLSVCGLVCACG